MRALLVRVRKETFKEELIELLQEVLAIMKREVSKELCMRHKALEQSEEHMTKRLYSTLMRSLRMLTLLFLLKGMSLLEKQAYESLVI
jgi:glycerophosphoryl diester phosphodiesterase